MSVGLSIVHVHFSCICSVTIFAASHAFVVNKISLSLIFFPAVHLFRSLYLSLSPSLSLSLPLSPSLSLSLPLSLPLSPSLSLSSLSLSLSLPLSLLPSPPPSLSPFLPQTLMYSMSCSAYDDDLSKTS